MIREAEAMSRLKRLTKGTIHPILSSVGFRRKGLAWNRTRAALVDVIDFQVSKASGPDSEHFTLNAGVFVPEFYRIVWQKEPPQFVPEAHCVVRRRVGELLSPTPERALDKWWWLKSDDATAECEGEIVKAVTENVLPFLGAIRSARDVHAFLENQRTWYRKFPLNRLYLAVARHIVGDSEGALRELREISSSDADASAPDAWSTRASAIERTLLPQI